MRQFVYQIYVPSFMDSDGDGYGDINGVRQRLDHVKSLGVDRIWLTPLFKSPLKDNGYDISDYCAVAAWAGTERDLRSLIAEASQKGLGVMLDMVFNHTSVEHKWFKGWVNGDPAYKDFYIAKESKGAPPTNWTSKFGGPAWEEYAPNQWYLHLYDKTQADLNWHNPKVVAELMKVLDHYVAMGVTGFRFDVFNVTDKTKYADDPDKDGRQFYTDGPLVHKRCRLVRERLPAHKGFLTVGEMSSVGVDAAAGYSNKDKTELDAVMMFHHLKVDYAAYNDKFTDVKPDITKLHEVLRFWYTSMDQKGGRLANFWNNHDQPRSASRFFDEGFGDIGGEMIFALSVCLPGDVYVYQGEELAMTDPGFEDPADYRDVETLNYLKEKGLKKAPKGVMAKSRDNSRTPMQWTAEPNAGFTQGTPWIKANGDAKKRNVESMEKDPDSVLHAYRKLIALGRNPILDEGSLSFEPFADGVIAFSRTLDGKTIRCGFNFANGNKKFAAKGVLLASNYKTFDGTLRPYQYVVVED